jgi:hypothetical protein
MASQQQNIDGSSIEHSNVQQTQARRDAVSFLNSHDNQVIIDNTFLKLFPQSDRSQVDWEWGLKLLEQKQLPEIRKRLTDIATANSQRNLSVFIQFQYRHKCFLRDIYRPH